MILIYLQAIDHPSVIRLYDAIDTEEYLYIVLELADGGELFDKIRDKTRLTEPEAKVVFIQVVIGNFLHFLFYLQCFFIEHLLS